MEKTKKQNRKYDRNFKEAAVKLSYERKSVSATARELGVDPKILRRWRKEYGQFNDASFQGNGISRLTPEQKRIRELEKELEIKKKENEILKKAVGIISASDR